LEGEVREMIEFSFLNAPSYQKAEGDLTILWHPTGNLDPVRRHNGNFSSLIPDATRFLGILLEFFDNQSN
jgi:membrane protein involved in colicin uptake